MRTYCDLESREFGTTVIHRWRKFLEGTWRVERFYDAGKKYFILLRNSEQTFFLNLESDTGIFDGLAVGDKVCVEVYMAYGLPDFPKVGTNGKKNKSYEFYNFSLKLK